MLDADDLRIEGIMPGGSKSTFTLPVISEACRDRTNNCLCRAVYCFGSSADVGTALHRKLLMLSIPFTAMSLHAGTATAAIIMLSH
jgi:hypothetical protein